uniref:Sfi1 spindle body domain-containing protein n=1 Tax=Kwoniella dejecticola CBS 10117 TaxID=1296121 RepID=A0A1A5ZZ64_9TREE|nr:uncharacterized protein I303_06656 [Kwoniella dejecticola CBS 10117]OBR83097.1 hypothetical protein I303_06656 [Kwoniella dejecticola CBS 10117]
MLAYSPSFGQSKSTLTDSTSSFANVDLEVVEKIFERGKHATSFPQIYRPYTEVLQECGISPTNDSIYYGFLLKIGVIKAATWGDKWSIWKASRSSPSTPTFVHGPSSSTPETNTEYTLETTHSGTNPSFSNSQLPSLRARVPFLASASSDIDEGFAPSIDGHGHGHGGGSGHSRNGSRSLVWYTPEQSFKLDSYRSNQDLLDFDPPMRTSTPVLRSPRYTSTHARLDPPAYSVSDVSQALEGTTEDLSALGLTNPKGKCQSPAIQQEQTWMDKLDEISESERRFMEKKGDDFYKLGLLGRCWDMWFKTSEFYRVTYKNIPIARNNLLLRQVVEKWTHATRHQLSLPGTADRHRQLHLKLTVLRKWTKRLKDRRLRSIEATWTEERRLIEVRELFNKWKDGAERRRTEKWKIEMAEKELALSQRRNNALMKRSLGYWRIETRGKLAQSDERQRLTWDLFEEWYHLTMQQRNLKSVYNDMLRRKLQNVFTEWRKQSMLKPMGGQIARRQEVQLVRKVWDDWRTSSWQAKQSATFGRRRILLTVMDRWKVARRKHKTMERKAILVDQTRLLDTSLRKWKLRSWCQLLIQAKDKRLQEWMWARWKARQRDIVRLESMANQQMLRREDLKVQKVFSRWRSIAASHQTDHLRAVLIHEKNAQSRVLSKWRTSTGIIQTNRGLADKAHAFFLLRSAFKVWRSEDAGRKAEKWIERRSQTQIKQTFDKWKILTLKYGDLHRREVVIRDHAQQTILTKALGRWTQRVIEIKDRELRISRARDDQVISELFSRWRGRLAVLRQNQKKADDTLEIRELENLRRVFRSWRGKTKRHKRLRLTAETSLVERENKLVKNVFVRWYEKKREGDLQEIEKEVAFLHENVILYGVMDKWKAFTAILPGISADSSRLKRKAMRSWLVALARKRRADILQRDRNAKLLAEAFQLWRDATAHKAAMNARRIRGRSRPSTMSDRRSSLGLGLGSGLTSEGERIVSGRRITPTSSTFPFPHPSGRGHDHNQGQGRISPGLISIGRNDDETVRSEPVYSRLRFELGLGNHRRRSRGASEEYEAIERPRSGSEMIRALRGNMPGR